MRAKILIRSAARTGRGREVAVTDGRDDGKGVDTRFNVFDACQTATKPLKSNYVGRQGPIPCVEKQWLSTRRGACDMTLC